MTGTTREGRDTSGGAVLHVALELDDLRWTLTMGTAMGGRPRQRRVLPRDRAAVLQEIEETKRRFGLAADVRVVSCYEAGREAFWLHRWLESEGIENRVVDSASIEVNRRKRRVKADRLDGRKLLRMLIRHEGGEKGVWSVVRVPSVEAEDARHLHRELTGVKRDRVRVTNRIKGLLAGQGVRLEVRKDFLERLDEIRLWDGSALPPGLRARLERAWEQRRWLTKRIQELEAQRRALLRTSDAEDVERVRQLMLLDGIGESSAWVFVTEFFGWRQFRNRREVGALAGLAPDAVPERCDGPGAGHQQGGQPARAWNRRTGGLGVAPAPTGERAEPLVQPEVRARELTGEEDRDHRPCQAPAHRAVALPGDGGDPRGSDSPRLTQVGTNRRPEERPETGRRGPRSRPDSEMGSAPSLPSADALAADRALGDRPKGQAEPARIEGRPGLQQGARRLTPEATGREGIERMRKAISTRTKPVRPMRPALTGAAS